MSDVGFAVKKVREGQPNDLERYISAFPTQLILKTRQAYTADNLLEYIGYALPGTPVSSPAWLIKKFTYSSGLQSQTDFASGDAKFTKAWDDRTEYTYS